MKLTASPNYLRVLNENTGKEIKSEVPSNLAEGVIANEL